jgi:phosphocarrier protein
MTEVRFILTNALGLHARPAAKITKIATKYKSDVIVCGNNKTADAKSISMLMAIGLPKGAELRICADGPDEKDCIEEIRSLVDNHFYEE